MRRVAAMGGKGANPLRRDSDRKEHEVEGQE